MVERRKLWAEMSPDERRRLESELSNSADNQKKLEIELVGRPQGYIVLIETIAENALETGLDAIRILLNQGYNGIVVSASRPYTNLVNLYTKSNVDTKKIFIIDCISEGQSSDAQQNAVFLEHVSDLTNISIAIINAIESIKGKKFVFIDSITTLLIHNPAHTFAKFIHSILTRLRIDEVSCIFISLEDQTNKEVRAEIAQLCDKIIKL